MENNQNPTREKPNESSDIQLSRSHHSWREPVISNFLHQLIDRRPWLVWIGVGTFLVLIIYISLFSILQPTTVGNKASEPTPTVTNPTDRSLPLWLLAGATLGSVAGSVAIAKKLQDSPQFAQLYQRLQFTTTTARYRRRKLLQHEQQVLSTPPVTSEPIAAKPLMENHLLQSPAHLAIEENFILLPEEQSPFLEEDLAEQSPEETMKILIVLDELPNSMHEPEEAQVSRTESLAEMLDLRKKLPLSTVLGEYNFKQLDT